MKIRWTAEAVQDERLYEFAAAHSPEGALRVVRRLRDSVDQLGVHPRLGPRLPGFGEREVRRLLVDDYEMRYDVASEAVHLLRFFHSKEDR